MDEIGKGDYVDKFMYVISVMNQLLVDSSRPSIMTDIYSLCMVTWYRVCVVN